MARHQLSHNNYEAYGFRLESGWIHFILRKLNFLLIVQFSLFSFFSFSSEKVDLLVWYLIWNEVGSDTWGISFTLEANVVIGLNIW